MRALISWHTFDEASGWQAQAGDSSQTTTLLGPETAAPAPFTEAIPSWAADTPLGSWIEIEARARVGPATASDAERWTTFYRIARWDDQAVGSTRQSFDAQRDADGRVATDTLVLQAPADAIQLRIVLHAEPAGRPALRALRVALSGPSPLVASATFTPRELPVPLRSQMAYPNGPNICSPTSLAMLLAYWQARTAAPQLTPFAASEAVADVVVPLVYDPAYDGHGNWAFNTAFAASHGMEAYVARFESLAQLEPWLAAGVPVAITAAWQPGELDGAPISSSAGHLLVVTGFDANGGVIVADPRAEHVEQVRRVYDAGQLEAAWQHKSSGTAYIVYPPGWPVPPLSRTLLA
jgi:uncharacterized protein YvpB